MIPAIGVIIGCYTIVRYISFCTRKGDRAENLLVKILSGLALAITLVTLFDLIMAGSKATPGF